MKYVCGFMLVAVLFFFAGCGTENNEKRTQYLTETVIAPDQDDVADMDNGTAIAFPAGTFSESAIILMSDTLIGDEIDAALFPEGAQTILGALILNSPIDTMFRKNVSFTFVLKTAQAAGSTWKVFKFDDVARVWVEIVGVVAFVDTSGLRATCTMPSSGVKGYNGSFALFQELPSGETPNIPPEFGVDGLVTASALTTGTTIPFSCAVTDANGDTLTFEWGDANADHGEFTNPNYADGVATADWTTDTAGDYTISLIANDGSGTPVSISKVFTIT